MTTFRQANPDWFLNMTSTITMPEFKLPETEALKARIAELETELDHLKNDNLRALEEGRHE